MDFFTAIFSSNLVQLCETAFFGSLFFLLARTYKFTLSLAGYLIASGIVFSFLFNEGEVYTYNDQYRRAFFVFGDGITTVLVFFFCYALVSNKKILALATSISILLSGGKISILLLLIVIFLL